MRKNLVRVDYVDRYAIDLPEPMGAPRFCALILEAGQPDARRQVRAAHRTVDISGAGRLR